MSPRSARGALGTNGRSQRTKGRDARPPPCYTEPALVRLRGGRVHIRRSSPAGRDKYGGAPGRGRTEEDEVKREKEAKGYFVVRREEGSQYGRIEIAVRDRLEYYGASFGEGCEEFNLAWQCDNQCDYWYAFRVTVRTDTPADLIAAGKLLARVLPDAVPRMSPEVVVDSLRRAGFVQVAYHRGMGRYYPVDKWPQGDVYMAVYRDGNGDARGVASVLAEDVAEARRKLLAQAAKELADYPNGYMAGYWEKWIAGGQVVHKVAEREDPKVPTLRVGVRDPGPEREEIQVAGV